MVTFTERLLLKLSLKLLDVQSFHGKNLIRMKCHFINALGGMVSNHKSSGVVTSATLNSVISNWTVIWQIIFLYVHKKFIKDLYTEYG